MTVAYDNPGFERWERDWVTDLLGDVPHTVVFDPEHAYADGPAVLAISHPRAGAEGATKADAVERQLRRLRAGGHRAGVLHLSDECGLAPVGFYRSADFVFRNYLRALPPGLDARYFGIGYKAGLGAHRSELPIRIDRRRHRWSFAGQMKNARHVMLGEARRLPGGAWHLTEQWNDPRGLGLAEYGAMLSDSVFVLCPRGNYSVDCFRVYEALEAGAIPIVEDESWVGGWSGLAARNLRHKVNNLIRATAPTERRKLANRSYWLTAYGPSFPCPRIHYWEDLRRLVDTVDVQATAAACAAWWASYKRDLRRRVSGAARRLLQPEAETGARGAHGAPVAAGGSPRASARG